MNKKLLCMFMLSSAISMNRSAAQQFIRNYTIPTTGVSQDWPVDVNYHSTQDKYYSLHYSSNGNMTVLKYDGTSYASLSGISMAMSGVNLDPQAMVHKGNGTVVLFNLSSGNYGLVAYNNTTNTIAWQKSYSAASTVYSITARDIVMDATNNTLYIVGDLFNNSSGRVGLYLAQVNATTGALNWHEQITNGVYDFSSNNIFFNSTSDIYAAAGASNPSNLLDRGAYIVDISSSGALNSAALIRYDTDCNHNRLSSPSVKRLGSDVYVFCPSVIGPDGSGDYFLAKMNATLSTINNYHIYFGGSFYFLNFVAPKFEFVNNNQNIMVAGTRSLLNSSIPGYIHAIYDLNTAFVSAYNYPYQSTGTYSSPIFDSYNPNSNEVFTVAEDYSTPSTWYGIRNTAFGSVDPACDTVYNQDSTQCRLLLNGLDISKNFLHVSTTDLGIKVKIIDQHYDETCTHTPCNGCALTEQQHSTKSLDAKNSAWNLYPNPAASVLELTYSSGIRSIVISNIKGERIKTVSDLNTMHYVLDISGLPPGMYFIQATGSDQQTLNRKFVKE